MTRRTGVVSPSLPEQPQGALEDAGLEPLGLARGRDDATDGRHLGDETGELGEVGAGSFSDPFRIDLADE